MGKKKKRRLKIFEESKEKEEIEMEKENFCKGMEGNFSGQRKNREGKGGKCVEKEKIFFESEKNGKRNYLRRRRKRRKL